MDPELIVAAILREREADLARLDRISEARATRRERADAAPGAHLPGRPHPLLRAARALSPRTRAARKLQAGG